MKKQPPPYKPIVVKIDGKRRKLYIVPFFSDFGFKVTWVEGDLFPKKALQAALGFKSPIEHITMLRNELSGMGYDGKGGIYDVICQDELKRVFVVEMQDGNYQYLIKRVMFYTFEEFCSLIPKGSPEESYKDLPEVYCICFVKSKCLKGENYHQRFSFKNDEGEELYPNLQFHFLEMGKFPILRSQKHLVKTDLEKLLYTMKYAHTINPKDPKIKPDFWEEEWLSESITELELARLTPQQRAIVNMSLAKEASIKEARQDEIDEKNELERKLKEAEKMNLEMKKMSAELKKISIQEGMEKGMEKGLMLGVEKEKIKTVLHLKKEGLSMALISRVTELPVSKVKKIIALHEPKAENGDNGHRKT